MGCGTPVFTDTAGGGGMVRGRGRGYVFPSLPSIIQQIYKYEAGC